MSSQQTTASVNHKVLMIHTVKQSTHVEDVFCEQKTERLLGNNIMSWSSKPAGKLEYSDTPQVNTERQSCSPEYDGYSSIPRKKFKFSMSGDTVGGGLEYKLFLHNSLCDGRPKPKINQSKTFCIYSF